MHRRALPVALPWKTFSVAPARVSVALRCLYLTPGAQLSFRRVLVANRVSAYSVLKRRRLWRPFECPKKDRFAVAPGAEGGGDLDRCRADEWRPVHSRQSRAKPSDNKCFALLDSTSREWLW